MELSVTVVKVEERLTFSYYFLVVSISGRLLSWARFGDNFTNLFKQTLYKWLLLIGNFKIMGNSNGHLIFFSIRKTVKEARNHFLEHSYCSRNRSRDRVFFLLFFFLSRAFLASLILFSLTVASYLT